MIEAVAIAVENLEMAYGEQTILDKAALTIHEGERVGLVGSNGCGKSTFMKILTGFEEPDDGLITRKKGLTIGYLPQEFMLDELKTVDENVRKGLRHITDLIAEYESLPHDSEKLYELEEEITRIDGWNLDHKIDSIVAALKCPPKKREISNLSGGEKRRVALTQALISEPDLLILDEPTNHIDTTSIEWLEDFLKDYKGTCLFVTHDRYFLDRISTRIVELRRGQFQTYKGNYSNYLTNKAEQLEREEVSEKKRLKFLKKELEWVRRGPKARTTKAQFRVNRYYDLAAQEAPENEVDVELIIPPAARMGNWVVKLKNVMMSFDDSVLFKDLTFEFEPGSKIGIVGPNGVGKSTLIKTIIDKIQPVQGTVKISQNTQFNYVDQERLTLNDDKTVVEEIGEGYDFVMLGEERISIWGYLKRFLFTDERIKTNVSRLSGGERARLLLAKILKNGGNFIVLDEPTNDLDLSTLSLLEEALIRFKGCVLLVSHDRYFLNRVCSGILAFEDNAQVIYSVGNYDYYMSKRVQPQRAKEQVEEDPPEKKPVSSAKTKVRKLKWKEERELESMEETILAVEEEIEELQFFFVNPENFKDSPEKHKEVHDQLEAAQSRKDKLYNRWEELGMIKDGKVGLNL